MCIKITYKHTKKGKTTNIKSDKTERKRRRSYEEH